MSNLQLKRIQLGTDRVLMVPSPEDGTVELRKGTAEVPGDLIARFDENGLVDPRVLVDVTAQRSVGSTYTNNTKMEIVVIVGGTTGAGTTNMLRSYVDGGTSNASSIPFATTVSGLSFSVPPGASYKVEANNTTVTAWREYRLLGAA